MKIIIDADACPRTVREICLRLGRQYQVPVWTVASFEHRLGGANHIMVGNDPQEADLKIINLAEPGDIAVTGDWGLAAVLLGREARCLSPTGKRFSRETIDFLLEERNIKARVRRGGGRTEGPHTRSSREDRYFAAALERLLSSGGEETREDSPDA